ncbi:MAG: hypothetical protein U0S12_10495 [Fimbriimonadales bacterium]
MKAPTPCEARQDRFLLKVVLDYPPAEIEREVLRRHHDGFRPQNLEAAGIQAAISPPGPRCRATGGGEVTVEDKIFNYILESVGDAQVARPSWLAARLAPASLC